MNAWCSSLILAAADAPGMAALRAVKGSGRRRVKGNAAPGKIGRYVAPGIPAADWLRARMAEAAFTLHRLMAEPAGLGPKTDRRK